MKLSKIVYNIRKLGYDEISIDTDKLDLEEINPKIKPYEEQLDILSKSFQPVIEAIQSLIPTIKTFANAMVDIYDLIKHYPNKRVVYLALHSKKKRTRKKNTNRIIREVIANGTRENF